MSNMERIIKNHNSKILSKNDENIPACNCQMRSGQQSCPMEGRCRTPNVVYAAEVSTQPVENSPEERSQPPQHSHNLRRRNTQTYATPTTTIAHDADTSVDSNTLNLTSSTNTQPRTTNETMIYIGAAEDFKSRFRNHLKSFRNQVYEKETELSKYIWQLQKNNMNYRIKWKIVKKTSGYNPISKTCNLCLAEKLTLCYFPDKTKLINKRNELISKCRHENKYLLINAKDL